MYVNVCKYIYICVFQCNTNIKYNVKNYMASVKKKQDHRKRISLKKKTICTIWTKCKEIKDVLSK